MLPNRIIISRKGCDGDYGKCPSFIFDDEILSVPIPETHFVASTKYADLKLPLALRKNGRETFADLIDAIPLKLRGEIANSGAVHLDPDIRRDALDEINRTNWKPRLGQCCNADAALLPVEAGDLFLFFGWYVHAAWGSQITFSKKKGFHALWGWLQVGRILRGNNLSGTVLNGRDHPHFAALRDGKKHEGNRNSIFEAPDHLTFRPNTSGAGVFKYRPLLRITHPACRVECKSLWRLPRFFHQRLKPLPEDAWCAEGEFTCVQSAGQNQEYVFQRPVDGSLDDQLTRWLHSLFQE